MPLPKPRQGEDQEAFMGRCMGDETVKRDFDSQDQRVAVCMSQWADHSKSNAAGDMPMPMQGEAHQQFMRRCMDADSADRQSCQTQWEKMHGSSNRAQLPAAPALAASSIDNRSQIRRDAAPPEAFDRWDMSIRAAAEDAPDVVSILGPIGEDIFGQSNNTARRISAALRSIGATKDITVHLNSPGGDFFEGLAVYNLLREHCGAVTVKVLGLAASAGAIIAMASDKLMMPKAGFLMIHNTQAVTIGDQHDHQQTVDLLKPFDDALAKIFAARTGLELNLVAKMLDEGTWLNGEEAVAQGFADAILPPKATKSDPALKAEAAPTVATHKLDAILARSTDMSRADRRKFIKDVRGGMPGAAATGTRDAADQESPLADVLAQLRSVTLT